MPDRSRCPNCKEPVSPFAAGCAVCGADLDTRRWDTGPSAVTRAGSWFSSLGMGASRTSPWILALVLFLLFGGVSLITALIYSL
jgi:hypothetical protein